MRAGVPYGESQWCQQPAIGRTRNVVISMTAHQPAPRPRAWQAVRRAARALKNVNDQQVLMWEAFVRSNRFPEK
jgi:hypothetical protein